MFAIRQSANETGHFLGRIAVFWPLGLRRTLGRIFGGNEMVWFDRNFDRIRITPADFNHLARLWHDEFVDSLGRFRAALRRSTIVERLTQRLTPIKRPP
ncbi:MAG: hypothetical protein KDM91_20940, partial [Verrucomicrobiae bacterium]|nr:hypothetical protein [Verrucomicrobiae bacterium]